MAKEAYYFSHDANARHDEKILELRAEYGWEGYGIYWAVIESLRDADGYKYNRKRLAGLALSLGVPKALLESVLFDFDLFRSDDEYVWSERLLRTMAKKEELSKAAKDKAAKRWNSEQPEEPTANAPAMPQHSNSIASAMQGNKKKEKEIKEEEIEEKEDSCSEPFHDSEPEKVINSFLLVGKGTVEFQVTESMAKEFAQLYPAVDIEQELRNIRAWCISNPQKRKTKAGATRFLNSWLSRQQNNPHRGVYNGRSTNGTTSQQHTDFTKLADDNDAQDDFFDQLSAAVRTSN